MKIKCRKCNNIAEHGNLYCKLHERKCFITTSIVDTIECSKNGKFDFNGFPIDKCNLFPCDEMIKLYG